MAKNAKFKREYKLTVEGISTNGFAADIIEGSLKSAEGLMDSWFKQVNVKIERTK